MHLVLVACAPEPVDDGLPLPSNAQASQVLGLYIEYKHNKSVHHGLEHQVCMHVGDADLLRPPHFSPLQPSAPQLSPRQLAGASERH